MTPSTFKRNEKIAARKKKHENEISDIKKKMQDIEAMVKLVVN